MIHADTFSFAADHPVNAGHFPGNPIIPGALLLDAAIHAVAGAHGGTALIRVAKFFRPVRPGERLCIAWQAAGAGAISFECRLAANDVLVATGRVELLA